jgi:hypothetical protein
MPVIATVGDGKDAVSEVVATGQTAADVVTPSAAVDRGSAGCELGQLSIVESISEGKNVNKVVIEELAGECGGRLGRGLSILLGASSGCGEQQSYQGCAKKLGRAP